MRFEAERVSVLWAAKRMVERGLTIGDSGNVSLRLADEDGEPLVAITPHGRYYDDLAATDIPVVDYEGEPVEGELLPSVELMLHVAVYRSRKDVRAVIHAHPMWASAVAALEEPIPPLLEDQVIYLGGEIACAQQATTGSDELVTHAVEALGDRMACLLAHHGVLVVGKDARAALWNCQYLEKTALAFLSGRWSGDVRTLSPEALAVDLAFYRARN
jgi:L-fuculose-phosphate aldolase